MTEQTKSKIREEFTNWYKTKEDSEVDLYYCDSEVADYWLSILSSHKQAWREKVVEELEKNKISTIGISVNYEKNLHQIISDVYNRGLAYSQSIIKSTEL